MTIIHFGLKQWEQEYLQKLRPHDIYVSSPLSEDMDMSAYKDIEGITVFVDSRVSQKIIDALPSLKMICARSTGVDMIDCAYAQEKSIVVMNVPSYGERTVAEYTFALILALSRDIAYANAQVKDKGDFSTENIQGFDLFGKTLGVVGAGRIGKTVVGLGRAFGMNVFVSDPHAHPEDIASYGAELVPLSTLLQNSDIVTLHVPAIPETEHLMNEQTLFAMKKGSYLINTSRGQVVDTPALVKALKSGHLRGAGLDVLEEEGIVKDEISFLLSAHPKEHDLKAVIADHALIDMPHVIVTPHNAFNTKEAVLRILDTTVTNISSYESGTPTNTLS